MKWKVYFFIKVRRRKSISVWDFCVPKILYFLKHRAPLKLKVKDGVLNFFSQERIETVTENSEDKTRIFYY